MRMVMIEWEDSYGCSSRWEDLPEKPDRPRVAVCRSIGWLWYDGPDCKVIVPHMVELNELRQGCGDMTIPSCAVLRVTELDRVVKPWGPGAETPPDPAERAP